MWTLNWGDCAHLQHMWRRRPQSSRPWTNFEEADKGWEKGRVPLQDRRRQSGRERDHWDGLAKES